MNYLAIFIVLAVLATIGIIVLIIYFSNKSPVAAPSTNSTCTPQCINGQTCVSGTCQSTPNVPSAPGCGTGPACVFTEVCQSEKCTPKSPCSSSEGCSSGETCINEVCTPNTCEADCSGTICINNICQFCSSDEQCLGEESCLFGYCVPNTCMGTCTVPGAPDIFTCSANGQCAINKMESCPEGYYLNGDSKNGTTCFPNPKACDYDTDCDSDALACFMGACLPTCDINAPNACIGNQVCVPKIPSTYYPGGEDFISVCAQCDVHGNCTPPTNMNCAQGVGCPKTYICGSNGICEFVPQSNSTCTDPGYSMVGGECKQNAGASEFYWQSIDLTNTSTPITQYTGGAVPLWALLTDTSGRTPADYGVPNVLGMKNVLASDRVTEYYTMPVVFTPSISPLYGPQFGYLDYWNAKFYSWDSGVQTEYKPGEVLSAAYLSAPIQYNTPPYSGAESNTINDLFMTYNGVPFCYNAPANTGSGPSVFTAMTLNNTRYKYGCIIPFQTSNSDQDTYTVQFGSGTINPVPVYRSCVNGTTCAN